MRLSKTFAATAVVVMLSAGSALAAGDGMDFKVDEGTLVTGTPHTFIADSFNFHWDASVQQQTDGILDYSAGDTFREVGNFYVTSFDLDNRPIWGTNINHNYGLIGLFDASGLAGLFLAASGPGINVQFSSFNLSLGLDLDNDGMIDIDLGSATLLRGEANLTPAGIAKGDYHVVLEFKANSEGERFFIEPNPFILELDLSGVLSSLDTADISSGSFSKQGSGDAWVSGLEIPEPASLALFGLGLFCLAGISSRQKVCKVLIRNKDRR
ncbi:MAG: flocculation-associated PEP-CTERM protein PepA [Candidatus Accumulibacter sp.]|jgi:hypothetical protein|nr:flocculation-associated PEP-CTERM protein PepA [Accumulibacter sp.]